MDKRCLVIGHRGAKGYMPENTLPSIKKALEINVDGIEIDVHLCASGELVVFHDFTVDKLTDGNGEVAQFSLNELNQFKVEQQYKIPTLIEVIEMIDAKCLLNIELKGKNTAPGACEIIQDAITKKGWHYSHFIVSSFQHNELEYIFNYDQNIPLAVLTKASVSDALEFARTINAKAIHPNQALITRDNVKRAQQKGYKVNVWTVNDIKTIERMKQYGVDAIISDYPDRV